MTQEAIWVSPTILNEVIEGYGSWDLEDWDLPYTDVNHAFTILEQHNSAGFLKDAIINLERAIKFRLKMLNDIYQFKHIPGVSYKNQLETMLAIGLIQPLMLEKIVKIRNGVQHQYRSAIPCKTECLELVEFAWYFLKSTDSIAKRKIWEIEISCGLDEAQASYQQFKFYPEHKWLITASLTVPQELIRKKQETGWLHFLPYKEEKHGKSSLELFKKDYSSLSFVEEYSDIFHINGVVAYGTSFNKAILKHYFSVGY